MTRAMTPLVVLVTIAVFAMGCTAASAKPAQVKQRIHKLFGRVGQSHSLTTSRPANPGDARFLTDFNQRRGQVEYRIGDAATSGRITRTQAADLRASLSGIVFRKHDYAGTGRITEREQRELMADLDRLNGKVNLALKGPQYWM